MARLGNSIDVAVVNGVLHGYEIKSDRDRLNRLPRQVVAYGQVVDFATLVVGHNHLAAAVALLPAWWEVLEVDDEGTIKRRRPGSRNPMRSARALAQLLWLEDAQRMLEGRGGLEGLRRAPRERLCLQICARYELEEIAKAARATLKARPRRVAARRQQ